MWVHEQAAAEPTRLRHLRAHEQATDNLRKVQLALLAAAARSTALAAAAATATATAASTSFLGLALLRVGFFVALDVLIARLVLCLVLCFALLASAELLLDQVRSCAVQDSLVIACVSALSKMSR